MRRIIVLGQAGAGKSTFARALSAALDLPVCHTDAIAAHAGQAGAADITRKRLDAIQAQERWIIDGIYAEFPRRIAQADTLILLDLPLAFRLLRVLRRWLGGNAVGHRSDVATADHLRLLYGMTVRRNRIARKHAKVLKDARMTVVCHVLRGDRQTAAFLDSVTPARSQDASNPSISSLELTMASDPSGLRGHSASGRSR